MKHIIIILGLLLSATYLHAQVQPLIKDDQSRYFYEKTNFKNVDTLSLWNYKFNRQKVKLNDSAQSLGSVSFWRVRPLDDSISKRIYGRLWSPFITYMICNIADSAYCRKLSKDTRYFSNCVPPDVGGDYFIIGNYIFINHDVCLNCRKYDTGVDYCRPVINFVISKVNQSRVSTLDDIFKQFVINEGNKKP